jgi:hypothetical protein
MADVENKTFNNETVHVDGNSYIGCTFTRTTLIFSAGEMPEFANCEFEQITLDFDGAAQNTLLFLSGLYRGGFQRGVETIFDGIRQEST